MTPQDSSTRYLRPAAAAAKLGIGLSTFWSRAKDDEKFPALIRLSSRITVVREDALDAYVLAKADSIK